jgi:outer membrane lipopolysaccharide assembly protein LptE/RlpB
MKTILSTTLLLFLTLFLSACDSKTSEVKVVEGNVESFGPPK